MTKNIPLTLAVGEYEITRPLMDGTVQPDGWGRAGWVASAPTHASADWAETSDAHAMPCVVAHRPKAEVRPVQVLSGRECATSMPCHALPCPLLIWRGCPRSDLRFRGFVTKFTGFGAILGPKSRTVAGPTSRLRVSEVRTSPPTPSGEGYGGKPKKSGAQADTENLSVV